jgi:hypothetical protein
VKSLIRKILKEEFQNDEVMSQEKNICDIMVVNSWDEIEELLDVMEYDEQYQEEIDSIKRGWEKEIKSQANDLDTTNFYLRKIQNIICK